MARITNALLSSKYSIHDLSRCRGEADLNLARFNMPLELGMAMALGSMKLKDPNRHDWLVLVPQGHLYKRFVSDLAGFDPMEHDQRPETLIPAVMSWLATRPEAVYVPTPNAVLSALDTFSKEKAHLSRDWHGQVPWADIVLVAIDIAKALPAK